ncbi:lysophospholipase, putative [Plasmodium berghei]|uniref:Lysophospholipase, putative n=2 Tax=Plasmodium berghei TaxID=5821 RepID=A0A509ADV8_PLABA|nr:lysophospholipase, putative [Plasmodium berghei ANKA]CXH85152.1 lysophospholipase, putative [Plasmodium berghei]SBW38200.1 lysophospholipase, putative [Plasmodium berghei]SCL83827.1 lysophospholipase, putative [Plasmodium berghei]SCL83966.1 lysophospholipase, putative [Plasmodium berghei]VUC53883.1 lysophospholipase, putative [Plasmodium berghei ANKA]|eukprot:XP_034419739.1 lysophospholipase, putative [Plasmodium berghei ANKA]
MEEIELNNDELMNTKCNLDGDPKTNWFCNKNGLLLKTYGWLVKNAIGVILLIHGLKSHTRLTYMKINLKMPNNNEGLVVDNNNYYIYKDSWIENFNQNGYSVYALDLQGHGESQGWENIKGNFSCFDDLVDDVIQYMNQIQDEISNDNQTDDESNHILTTEKKRLPMYIIGHSLGGGIALRILQLLRKEQEDSINSGDASDNKKCNIMLGNSTNINEIDNDMVEDIINDMHNSNDRAIECMNNTHLVTNSNGYDSDNSCYSASSTTNAIDSGSDQDRGCYNHLDKLNIKGCITLSGMMRFKTIWNARNDSIKRFYLPAVNFMSRVAPHARISSELGYKRSKYVTNICKYDKFRNNSGIKFKCIYEIIKASITLNCNIKYMPKDVPLFFVHSKDDSICYYKGAVSFHNQANVNKKNLHIVDGMNHAITVEPGNENILKKIIEWISNLRRDDEIEDEK